MTRGQRLKVVGTTMAFAGVAMAGILFDSPRGRADDRGGDSDSRIEQGFEIAPVPLNLEGKNPALVGLGSYFVNGPGDCNACHNPGPGNNQFLPGGNLSGWRTRFRRFSARQWYCAYHLPQLDAGQNWAA